MKYKGVHSLLLAVVCALPAAAGVSPTNHISGHYLEARTADVYTGPCFANSQVNLAGHEAVLAWHIERGLWNGVGLDGLTVVAVVRANATLGDPYAKSLRAKSLVIVDARANAAQRAALVNFAQAQAVGLLDDILGLEASPIRFTAEPSRHGYATLEVAGRSSLTTAGSLVRVSTRAISSGDEICHNEEVYYPPLAANLSHVMPAVASESSYRGSHLGVKWSEAGRRSSFVGTFSF